MSICANCQCVKALRRRFSRVFVCMHNFALDFMFSIPSCKNAKSEVYFNHRKGESDVHVNKPQIVTARI